jgi:hypothetical protein
MGSVIAVAGRRIDPVGAASSRFPLSNVPKVAERVRNVLETIADVVTVVASAACGADLIVLEEAERLGLRRRIVLPFEPNSFRKRSVEDRPGSWGSIFDRQIRAALAAKDLIILDAVIPDDEAYASANEAIIRECKILSTTISGGPHECISLVIREKGALNGSDGPDATAHFASMAAALGFKQVFIFTD